MKLRQLFSRIAPICAMLALAACGGGNGNSYVTPPNGGTAPTRTSLELATELLTKSNQLLATAAPATGAAQYANEDACYVNNGGTKAYWIQKFDEDAALSQAQNAYRIGSTRTNLSIDAERLSTNTDGSARREIDIKYDIHYTDGSKDTGATNTIVIGSTADGSCASPQDLNTARFLGNRQLIDVYVQSRNTRTENYSLATGNFVNLTSRREINFGVSDPMGNATYVIVSGPGTTTQPGGVATPFSLKLLSPRIVRDDPSMAKAGKRGYSTSFKNDDSFRACGYLNGTTPNFTAQAATANCVEAGTGGAAWGANALSTTLAASDTAFNNIGFEAGGVYTFAVHNDDGWKTVNGQAGKTPIATYTRLLEKLPYTFVEMGLGSTTSTSGVVTNDKFPGGGAPEPSLAGLASIIRAGTAFTGDNEWTPATPLSDGDVFKASYFNEYASGRSTANAAGVFWPEIRESYTTPLLGNATSATVSIHAKPSTMVSKTYAEFALGYTNRNGGRIINYVAWR